MSVGPAIGFLRIPPWRPVVTTPLIAELEGRIAEIARRSPNFVSTFGLELRAATVMAMDAEPSARHVLQRLMSRPAAEPVLLHTWKDLSRPYIDFDAMQKIASGLAAASLTTARGRMRTTAGLDGEFTVYAPPEQRDHLPAYLVQARAGAADHPLASAIATFALTILAHPLTDGNGRLARALFHGVLAQGGLIKAPVLPLAPAFYAQAAVIRSALRGLSDTGDWGVAIDRLSIPVCMACDLAVRTRRLVGSAGRDEQVP